MEEKTETTITILNVDDDRGMRQFLHDCITVLGHRSVTAVDGTDALGKLEHKHFDIVITDLKMPRMDGIELIKRIVADFPEVDVIAITGHQMTYTYTEIIALGASDFISKPFEIEVLKAKINRIVRERELRAELRRLSTRDGLTGLYNRRYFDENLEQEAKRALRQAYDLYLLFIDLDGLKSYNDQYGHPQGDKLLVQLANLISSNVRKDVDSAYRYGGDEFAIILPHASRKQALMVAERLVSKYNEKNLAPTSLSIGLTKWEGSRETLEEDLENFMQKADQALYAAKAGGGNQVCDEQGQVLSLAVP